MSTDEDQFIELGRTFHELSKHAGKSDDVDLSQVVNVKSNLKWNDVLDMPRAVILSEAGSGKTQEIALICLPRDFRRESFALADCIASDRVGSGFFTGGPMGSSPASGMAGIIGVPIEGSTG